jgi:UDP-N-acetylglucosamine 2-epimerase (non-hydrolysing)
MAKILCVAGARPNFVKIGPIMKALAASPPLEGYLVHTGQHYDAKLSDQFFEDLGLPQPDESLSVGSDSHAKQTAKIMLRFEPVLEKVRPACVVVVGDVNSTIACALVAAKLDCPVAHVEAGLRSFDRRMPEEINRVLTDQIADLLFVTEPSGVANLEREGIDPAKIHHVGNVMIDALFESLPKAVPVSDTIRKICKANDFSVEPASYGLITLHRPSNVDNNEKLKAHLESFGRIAKQCPLIFPMHPRTRARLEAFGLEHALRIPNLFIVPPLGYLEFLGLIKEARLVITDSGGIQEETTALGVPCLTVRENTERPITVEVGTNVLVGTSLSALETACRRTFEGRGKSGKAPPLWDGRSAERIVAILQKTFGGS